MQSLARKVPSLSFITWDRSHHFMGFDRTSTFMMYGRNIKGNQRRRLVDSTQRDAVEKSFSDVLYRILNCPHHKFFEASIPSFEKYAKGEVPPWMRQLRRRSITRAQSEAELLDHCKLDAATGKAYDCTEDQIFDRMKRQTSKNLTANMQWADELAYHDLLNEELNPASERVTLRNLFLYFLQVLVDAEKDLQFKNRILTYSATIIAFGMILIPCIARLIDGHGFFGEKTDGLAGIVCVVTTWLPVYMANSGDAAFLMVALKDNLRRWRLMKWCGALLSFEPEERLTLPEQIAVLSVVDTSDPVTVDNWRKLRQLCMDWGIYFSRRAHAFSSGFIVINVALQAFLGLKVYVQPQDVNTCDLLVVGVHSLFFGITFVIMVVVGHLVNQSSTRHLYLLTKHRLRILNTVEQIEAEKIELSRKMKRANSMLRLKMATSLNPISLVAPPVMPAAVVTKKKVGKKKKKDVEDSESNSHTTDEKKVSVEEEEEAGGGGAMSLEHAQSLVVLQRHQQQENETILKRRIEELEQQLRILSRATQRGQNGDDEDGDDADEEVTAIQGQLMEAGVAEGDAKDTCRGAVGNKELRENCRRYALLSEKYVALVRSAKQLQLAASDIKQSHRQSPMKLLGMYAGFSLISTLSAIPVALFSSMVLFCQREDVHVCG